MQHNTIRFAGVTDQPTITLVCTGTFWPDQVIVDGDVWAKTEKVEQTRLGSIRDYVWQRTTKTATG